jgi:hypothetical protein
VLHALERGKIEKAGAERVDERRQFFWIVLSLQRRSPCGQSKALKNEEIPVVCSVCARRVDRTVLPGTSLVVTKQLNSNGRYD